MTGKATTYWDYIRTEQLLALQTGTEADESGLSNDEVMFITIHQIDELWFKLVLRELISVRDLFARSRVPEQSLGAAARGIRRMARVFHHAAAHFGLMETMTTRDYLAFRDKLSPASGFQSAGLREVEILLGLPDEERVDLGSGDTPQGPAGTRVPMYLEALRNPDGSESPASRRVAARLADRPTLRDTMDEWLFRTPIDGSVPGDAGDTEVVRRFIDAYGEAHRAETDRARQLAAHDAMSAEQADALTARFTREVAGSRAFLLAEDVPEPDRARRSRIRAAVLFIESYRELPLLAWPREIIDSIVELEQAFVIFRQRHARMVERVIGRRVGTGGSAGVDYLDRTALAYRVFRDVWAVRTLLLRATALPALRHPDAYALGVDD